MFGFNPWRIMLMLWLVAIISFLSGCVSPAGDYVQADTAVWNEYDRPTSNGTPLLDEWINQAEAKGKAFREEHPDAPAKDFPPGAITSERADALRQLNTGRKARIRHAQASAKQGG